jgi:hypothetical protein
MIAPSNTIHLIKNSTGDEQLQALRSLRNSLIGHDDEKLEHAQNDTIPVLLDIVVNKNIQESCRIQASILIGSFAFGELISNSSFCCNNSRCY